MRILKRYMSGDDVKQLKAKLVELGFLKSATHNRYGNDTYRAVKAFQERAGLTPDGITGEKTWNALFGIAPPEPVIPSMLAELVCSLAHNYIGQPYVWSASGQDNPSDDWIKAHDKSDPNASISYINDLKRKGIKNVITFDCSGFVSFLWRKAGVWNSRRDCDGIWNACKHITKQELVAGDVVLRGSDTDKTHIGLYVGDGWVIHAKGRKVGVVIEPIDLSAGYWKYFGRYPYGG